MFHGDTGRFNGNSKTRLRAIDFDGALVVSQSSTPPTGQARLQVSTVIRDRRLGRDAVTWLVLGLVVTSILIVTTRGHHATPLSHSPNVATSTHHPQDRPSASPRQRRKTRSVANPPRRHAVHEIATSSPSTTSTTMVPPQAPSATLSNEPVPMNVSTPGTLSYPADIESTYPITVAAGGVAAHLSWPRRVELRATLQCRGRAISRSSTRGALALSTTAPAGSCLITVTRPGLVGGTLHYTITLSYRALHATATP